MTWNFALIRALALAALVLAALQWMQAHEFERLEARIWWAEFRHSVWGGAQ